MLLNLCFDLFLAEERDYYDFQIFTSMAVPKHQSRVVYFAAVLISAQVPKSPNMIRRKDEFS